MQQQLKNFYKVVVPILLESNVCRDPDDDMILATAQTGQAVCIITGDKDLLSLTKFGAIDILSPSEFEDYETQYGSDLE
jgi:uncharacterized protein